MKELFTLGEIYPSDFLKPDESPHTDKIELKLLMDDDGVVRLEQTAPLNKMFGRYFYRSGTNATMKTELKNIVNSITSIVTLQDNDVWIDVGANDGTLLSFVPNNLIRIGIDPADDTYKVESEKHADLIIQDFFSSKSFKDSKFKHLKAKIFSSIAMFYDLENPVSFIKDIDDVLDNNGIWVCQFSYNGLMIVQNAFDNICFKSNTNIIGSNKIISDLKKDDLVLDYNGNFTKVKQLFNRKYDGDLYKIKALYLDAIETTPEHPILIVKEENNNIKKTEWVYAKNIKLNDFVVLPKIKTEKINRIIDLTQFNKIDNSNYRRGLKSINLTDDVLWMMGVYLAEGHISGSENNLQINFTLNANEIDYANKIKNVFSNLGYKTIIRYSKISKSLTVQSSCTALARAFTAWFGTYAFNKKIPDFIFKSTSDSSIPFLNGLIDGDGSIELPSKQVGFHSASKVMIYQVQLMLATLNAMTGFSYVKPYEREIRGKKVTSKDSWQLRGKNKYLDNIFKTNPNKIRKNIRYEFDENYIYLPVSNIEINHYKGDVYNIETENNTYVVSNAIVHNCHEHVRYYSLTNIKKLLEDNGFKLMDCILNDINGGSFRIYAMKKEANESLFSSQPYRDVCNFRINSLIEYEKTLKLDNVDTWKDFFKNINSLKEETVSFIKKAKADGKKIFGYGASTKGNTLLQYFELDNTLIDAIADRSPYKWGLKTAGTNIPIISEQEMRDAKPDYLLILPWHFINEFKKRESEFLKNGGKMIVPCPKFEIIGY